MILTGLDLSIDDFERATGWELKPQGACHGETCVPLGSAAPAGGRVDVPAVADKLGMPVLHDAESGLYALGHATLGGRALASAVAPELELPDLNGKLFRLSSLRGKKVVLVAWSPY